MFRVLAGGIDARKMQRRGSLDPRTDAEAQAASREAGIGALIGAARASLLLILLL